MRIEAVIFDLDNTLYDEHQFVKSGFRTVSKHMAKEYSVEEAAFYEALLDVFLKSGRGSVFDLALKNFNIYEKETVLKMLDIYRSHIPDITLFGDAEEILPQIRDEYHTALLTDGLKRVQENKVEALKIRGLFDVITYAADYGGKNIQAFSATLERLRVEPSVCMYVDDNPFKGFAAAKKLGIHTVRILRGEHKDLEVTDERCEPEFEILNLRQLTSLMSSV